jgi:hypothetical protein
MMFEPAAGDHNSRPTGRAASSSNDTSGSATTIAEKPSRKMRRKRLPRVRDGRNPGKRNKLPCARTDLCVLWLIELLHFGSILEHLLDVDSAKAC